MRVTVLALLSAHFLTSHALAAESEGASAERVMSTAPTAATELTTNPMAGQGPLEVRMQIILIDLENIDGAGQSFTVNLAYVARWSDPRLRHQGLGETTIPLEDIWHPRLQIVNRRNLQHTFPDEARVSPEGEVVSVQRVWGQLSQPLQLHDFPFDRQIMQTKLIGAGHEKGSVVFVADPDHPSSVADQLAISDWLVTGWNVEPLSLTIGKLGKPLPGFLLNIDVERDHSYHLVNTILPLVLIICMSWVVFWINPKNANPRISVSVTAMLTLIAYRFAIGTSLPKIGYLTRMDWFILGSSVLIFTALLEVVITSWLAEKDRMNAACRINAWMRFIAPLAFAVIVFASLF